jgi:hypothetical protein
MLKKLEDMRSTPVPPVSPAAALQAERRRAQMEYANQQRQLIEPSSAPAKAKSPVFQCHDCRDVFETRTALVQHEAKHAPETPIRCPDCSQIFKGRSALEQHIYQKHEQVRSTSAASSAVTKVTDDDEFGYYSPLDLYNVMTNPETAETIPAPITTIAYVDFGDAPNIKIVGQMTHAAAAVDEHYQALPTLPCASQNMTTSQGRPITSGNGTDLSDTDILLPVERVAMSIMPVFLDSEGGGKLYNTGTVVGTTSQPFPVQVIAPVALKREDLIFLAQEMAAQFETARLRRKMEKERNKTTAK